MLLGLTPTRISFGGGGTDMPEYYEKFGGIVISSTINHFSYVVVNKRKDNKLQIFSSDFETHNAPTKIDNITSKSGIELPVGILKFLKYKKGLNLILSSDVPPKSGLGSSSSIAVNLVNVIHHLNNKKISKSELAEISHNIERNYLKWPMGKQDEYIAAFGGFNKIEFSKKKIQVSPVKIKQKTLKELDENLMLFFIGSRTNTSILTNQINDIKNKEPSVLNSLDKVKDLAFKLYDNIKKSDLTGFGEILNENWKFKKKFSKSVSNNKIDKIYDLAMKSGSIGGKLAGAGGGGHLLLYCEKSKQSKVVEKMKQFKIKEVKFSFYNDGAKILNMYDYAGAK